MSSGGKARLVFVIIFGFLLLVFFGITLPLLVGKVATIHKAYKDTAEIYSKLQSGSAIKDALRDKRATRPVPRYKPTPPRQKTKIKTERNLEAPPVHIPASRGAVTKEVVKRVTKKDAYRKSAKGPSKEFAEHAAPDLTNKLDKGKKKVVTPEVETVLLGKKKTGGGAEAADTEAEAGGAEPLPDVPEVAFVTPSVDDVSFQEETDKEDSLTNNVSYEVLPQTLDLRKTSEGGFPVKIRVSRRDGENFQPQISYWVGTGDATGYTDMQAEEGDIWVYEIPDPGWVRYGSQFLFYKIRIINGEGEPVFEGQAEREFIDSFDNDVH